MAVNNSRGARRNLMAEFNESEDKPPNGNVNGESREQDPPSNDLSSIEFARQQLVLATQEASERWNFDFVNFQKLEGDWEWKLPHEEFSSPEENHQEENRQENDQRPEQEPDNREPAAS